VRHRTRWTKLALEDLRDIRRYVGHDRPDAARRLAGRIRAAVRRIALEPRSGRVVPEFQRDSLREVVVRPYRIVYAVRRGEADILRVWHGRRDLLEPDD
jgi:plasmid stabilization system protein ParE